MLLAKDFLIAIYNSLEEKSNFRSDLVDLFGTPDGSRKGYLGVINKPILWDWGIAGFRKTMQILYTLSGKDPNSFDNFYESKILHQENIIELLLRNEVIDTNPKMLYVFKYSLKRIPAFLADINEISWKKNEKGKWRILVTFQPKCYMILDPNTWKIFGDELLTNGHEDPNKWFALWNQSWDQPRPDRTQVEKMLHSGCSLDQYHIIPVRLLLQRIKERIVPYSTEAKTCFVKDITKIEKRLKLRVPTDNQNFWGLLSEFVGKTQVRGSAELQFNCQKYSITDIPANTIVEKGWVFKQEIGTAITICQVMLDVFGQDYLDLEFSNGNKKNILDALFLRRAIKISMIAKNYDHKYAETDFDYQLDLAPLTKKYPNVKGKILFDLTAGLWNKSIAKNKDEFIAQWEHNLLKFPEQNQEVQVIWHYGLNSEVKDGSYQGQEIGEYLRTRTQMSTIQYQPNSITNLAITPKLILLPFFRDSPVTLEKELSQISNDKVNERRRSMLYGALSELLKRMLS